MSLTFNIVKLAARDEPLSMQGKLDLTPLLDDRAEVVKAGALRTEAKATFGSGVANVKGDANADLTFACSRCLEPFASRVRFSYHEMFTREAEIAKADPEENVHLVKGEEVDLAPLLRENLLLELPLVFLCDEHCKGLCPQCGQNQNEASCACETERIDPRLADLKKFFKPD